MLPAALVQLPATCTRYSPGLSSSCCCMPAFPLHAHGFVCAVVTPRHWAVVEAPLFLLFGSSTGQTLAVEAQGGPFSVSRSPNCKEIFPNLKHQDQLSSQVQHPLLILQDFSVPHSPSPEGYVWIHTSAPAEPRWEPQILVFPTRPLYPLYLSSHPARRQALLTPGSVLRDPGAASFLKRTLQILPACPLMIIRTTVRVYVFLPILLNLTSLDHLSEGGPFQLMAGLHIIHQLKRNYLLPENNSTCIQKYMVFYFPLWPIIPLRNS